LKRISPARPEAVLLQPLGRDEALAAARGISFDATLDAIFAASFNAGKAMMGVGVATGVMLESEAVLGRGRSGSMGLFDMPVVVVAVA
jgi:hypothetical protein